MEGETLWPPETCNVSSLIKLQRNSDPSWRKFSVIAMRFYETYTKARLAVPKFVEDSNYETECEPAEGRGKRRRYKPAFLESDSDEDMPVVRKRAKESVPAPPPVSNRAIVKGQGPTRQEQKKQETENLMARLKAARAAAAARMSGSPSKSPWKVTPHKVQVVVPDKSPGQHSALVDSPDPLNPGDSSLPNTPIKSPENIDSVTPLITPLKEKLPSMRDDLPVRDVSFYFTPPGKKGRVMKSGMPSRLASCRSLFDKDNQNEQLSQCSKECSVSQSSKECSVSQSSKECSGKSSSRMPVQGEKRHVDKLPVDSSIPRLHAAIAEISAKVDILMMNMARLSRSLLPGEKRMSIPNNMPRIPLNTKEELDDYESFLEKSDVNLAAVVDYMSNYIRTNVVDPERKSASAILTRLLTNKLASGMNLEGGHNKIAFRKLNLYKVFQATLQTAFPKSDLKVADDALQKWLKDSKWRKQGVGA